MIITLPSDLSQKAASILYKKMQMIDCLMSSGHSLCQQKMSDSAMMASTNCRQCDKYIHDISLQEYE